MNRQEILERLRAQVSVNGHVVGAVVGSGMAAKFVAMAGIDFVLALSAGRFRMAGRGSYASYFCYGNSNEIVRDFGVSEILPVLRETPVFFGIFASDPFLDLAAYLDGVQAAGCSGIINYPTISLIDGAFRDALEEEGNTFALEVEAIAEAHRRGMFTLAFVTNASEARQMLDAGADAVCAHLGLTRGGYVGGHPHISLTEAEALAREVLEVCEAERPEVFRMVYSGPASTPVDMQYLYDNTPCQGYVGGSVFDRIPSEQAILDSAIAFKSGGDAAKEARMRRLVTPGLRPADYADFVKQYIAENYSREILLRDIALVLHVSYSHLSTVFSREVGRTFTEYLIRYRLNVAKELIASGQGALKNVALEVGYPDYAQFSKIFKKHVGVSPSEYAELAAARPGTGSAG